MSALEAARAFAFEGGVVSVAPHGDGHIHETFAASCASGRRYLVQRLNTHVFPEPELLAANIAQVTAHLRERLRAAGERDLERRVLEPVATREGAALHRDAGGHVWRAFVFVEGTRVAGRPCTPAQARAVAFAFGAFQRLLRDYAGPPLRPPLPGFHDTPRRFLALREALARDAARRAAGCAPEVEFALSREALAGHLLRLRAQGLLPEVMTHNDTKLDNVLLDRRTGEGLCVIDLDTVMPGLSLHDFGDLARSAASPAAEDETDLARVEVDPDVFGALAEGWRSALGEALLEVEREHMVAAARVITFETGLRFLADHLEGDHYFRARRPGHNLDRCRAQFALVRALEAREAQLLERLARPAR